MSSSLLLLVTQVQLGKKKPRSVTAVLITNFMVAIANRKIKIGENGPFQTCE